LISRKLVVTKLSEKLEEVDDTKKSTKRANNDSMDRVNDVTYSLQEFFNFIFGRISRASGNYVNLSFRFPDITKNKNKEMQKIIIGDALSTKSPIPEFFEFDPFKGDGNCLNLTVEGKLPTDLVGLALIQGIGEGSGTAGKISEEKDYLIGVIEEYSTILNKLTSTDPEDGVFAAMADKDFSEDTIADACSTLAEFKKILNSLYILRESMPKPYSFTEYFDLEMKVDMEGIYPIIAGNVFTSTNLPPFAKPSNGIGFVVMDVEDKIDATGVWTTTISTRASPYL